MQRHLSGRISRGMFCRSCVDRIVVLQSSRQQGSIKNQPIGGMRYLSELDDRHDDEYAERRHADEEKDARGDGT